MAVILFWPSTPAIFMSFSSYVFSLSSFLYTTLVTFGCSSIWGLLLLEARYFREAKDNIKSCYDCALFLPHGWVFSVLDPVIFHNSSWHKQYLPCCRVHFIRVQNTERGLEKCSKHPPARFFTFQFLLISNTRRVLPYDLLSYVFDLNIDHWEINML